MLLRTNLVSLKVNLNTATCIAVLLVLYSLFQFSTRMFKNACYNVTANSEDPAGLQYMLRNEPSHEKTNSLAF